MCGIVGVCSTTDIAFEKNWLLKAVDQLSHRGPDGNAVWVSKNKKIGFGHTRLSIIDLSPDGNQPMVFANEGVAITFNGEIYNFKELKKELINLGFDFKSNSDTEVLIKSYLAWGIDCLKRLNGMFSFAIHDQRNDLVFFARDRAGEKPFFYRHFNKSIYFSSELKGLLCNTKLPRTINTSSLAEYLNKGYVANDKCILEGFSKLPPSYAMLFNCSTGEIKKWRYYELPLQSDSSSYQPDEIILENLNSTLQASVSKQMVADVPVGLLLSGGLDSSLITHYATQSSSSVKTFNIKFPNNVNYDESKHARLIARHYGTDHTELACEEASVDLLPSLAYHFDEPMIDSSSIPTWLVTNLVRKHCTVAIGGDGGDELFGGYHHYNTLLQLKNIYDVIPYFIKKPISQFSKRYLRIGTKGKKYLDNLSVNFSSELPMLSEHFDAKSIYNLVNIKVNDSAASGIQNIASKNDIIQFSTRYDFHNVLPEDILVKVDRASMSNSLEVRAPFLDVDVVNLAFGNIPSRLKATSKRKKIILKMLGKKFLPKEFDFKRKQGFSIPLNAWLKRGNYREFFWDNLTCQNSTFNKKEIEKLFIDQDKGKSNGERLFGLTMFELWKKQFEIEV